MGKNRDLIQILLIVIIGMFIPFLGSLLLTFNLDITSSYDLYKIASTFGWFLLIFGLELGGVYLYFYTTNTLAQKKIDSEEFKGKDS